MKQHLLVLVKIIKLRNVIGLLCASEFFSQKELFLYLYCLHQSYASIVQNNM